MRRVVVTGIGIVSSIGNNPAEVTASLREARSGITFSESFAEHGFRSSCSVRPRAWGRASQTGGLDACVLGPILGRAHHERQRADLPRER